MWHFLTWLICFYGFIKEFKIGEPFIYLYQTEELNLTREQIVNEVRAVFFRNHCTLGVIPLIIV